MPTPEAEVWLSAPASDPAEEVELADTVGVALQVVLDRLTPRERVAFVLHDSFGFEFPTIAVVLDTTPTAARKLASRARGKVRQPMARDQLADWQVVDAFLAGTPQHIDGQHAVATFFNGAAAAALPVFIEGRPGAAWFHKGQARVAFDFTIVDGRVQHLTFRSDPAMLARVEGRRGESR